MNKLLITCFSRLAAFTIYIVLMQSSYAFANTSEYGIEVRGQASVLVEPDSFALSIVITEQGRLTDKIRAVVDHKSNQVIAFAKQLGIKLSQINSARVSLRVVKNNAVINVHGLSVNQSLPNNQKSKVFVSTNPRENNNQLQYFELSRTITVNFEKIKDYDQFLNQVIKIGVSHISPLAMSVGDTNKYYQQALTLAIKNAKTKAQQIAIQSEQSLGRLVYVKELSSNHYRSRHNASIMQASTTFEHNSQVGNQLINASVLVKYSIE